MNMQKIILLAVFFFASVSASVIKSEEHARPYVKELAPDAYSHWGEWGPTVFCPDNTWAKGYQLKVTLPDADADI